MADLKLKILMEAVDRVTAPFRAIRASSQGVKAALGQTAQKVRELETTAKQLERFRSLKAAARANADALAQAQARAQQLAMAMQSADKVTAAMRREFAAATADVNRLKDAETRQGHELQQLRQHLAGAGVDTKKLGAEQRRLKGELDAARAAADRQAASLERVAERAKRLAGARVKMQGAQATAGSMAGAGAAGLATGGGALAGAGAIASVGIDFEAMMSKVGALTKVAKTSEAFAALEKQAFDLGATTSFSASQAAEAMSNLAMAGFDAGKILGVMPSMLNLAKAGSTELGATASITANIMAGYGLQASQMGDVGDVLTATFTNSNTNLELLGETMKYVAPIAKAAGYSLGDMATMAGLLGNVGIQGSDAGTALRAALIRMADPPKEAQKALAALGVATKTASGDMRPMASVLADLAAKTKGLGNAEKIEKFSTIFGTEAASAITELVDKAGSKGIADFVGLMKQAHGLTDKIAGQMADNAKGDLDNLTSAIEGVAIIMTKINVQPLRELTQWASNVVTVTGEWMQANPQLAATLTRVAVAAAVLVAAGGALALAIAGILGPFAMARYAIMAVVPALWSMAAAALANPIVWIVAGIAAAAAALIYWWEPISGFFTGLWGQVAGIFAGAREGIKAALAFTPLGLILANWEPISGFFGDVWGRVTGIFTAASQWIEEKTGWSPLAAITAAWQPIADFFVGLWDGILAKIDSVWTAITDKVAGLKGMVDWVGSTWDSLFGDGKAPTVPVPASPTLAKPATVPVPAPVNVVPVPAAPLPAAKPPPPTVTQTNSYTITVHAAPGMTAEDVAREVRRQLEQRDAKARSAARSALYDQ